MIVGNALLMQCPMLLFCGARRIRAERGGRASSHSGLSGGEQKRGGSAGRNLTYVLPDAIYTHSGIALAVALLEEHARGFAISATWEVCEIY